MVATLHHGNALLVAAFALTGVLLMAEPARAADVFVQANPSTVQAGFLTGIKASCTDNSMPATVESPAFGTVTVQPQNGLLTAAALVPEATEAGSFRVRLSCPDGKNASTMLNVVAASRPSRGPATGFGGTADGDPAGDLLLVGGLATIVLGGILGLIALRRPDRPEAGRSIRGRTGV